MRIFGEIIFRVERNHSAKYSGRKKATTKWAIEINSGSNKGPDCIGRALWAIERSLVLNQSEIVYYPA